MLFQICHLNSENRIWWLGEDSNFVLSGFSRMLCLLSYPTLSRLCPSPAFQPRCLRADPLNHSTSNKLASVERLELPTSAFVVQRSCFHLSYTEINCKNLVRMAGLEPT